MSATAETATCKRVTGQSPDQSGSDSQNDHDLVQHRVLLSTRLRHSTETWSPPSAWDCGELIHVS
jgi:hypothetical protein